MLSKLSLQLFSIILFYIHYLKKDFLSIKFPYSEYDNYKYDNLTTNILSHIIIIHIYKVYLSFKTIFNCDKNLILFILSFIFNELFSSLNFHDANLPKYMNPLNFKCVNLCY